MRYDAYDIPSEEAARELLNELFRRVRSLELDIYWAQRNLQCVDVDDALRQLCEMRQLMLDAVGGD